MALRNKKKLVVTSTHLDATGVLFFTRELEEIDKRLHDVKYAEKKTARLIPQKTDLDPGAETFVAQSYDSVGLAKLITAYGDDLPRVDIKRSERSAFYKNVGISYAFNVDEIRSAQKAGVPLEFRRAAAARNAIDEKLDRIQATGDSETGLLGVLNQPNIPTHTIPNGASSSPLWSSKTPKEILFDMHAIAKKVVTQSNDVETPNTMLLPLPQYLHVATTRMSDDDSTTILKAFLESSPWVTSVEGWLRLAGAGAGGTDRALCYRKSDEVLEHLVPIPFEQLSPQERNLETVIACRGKSGGVVVWYPLACVYADGI